MLAYTLLMPYSLPNPNYVQLAICLFVHDNKFGTVNEHV